ncbi:unnamed protein product [Ostreobium quekettii]|uniref:Defective in cullin neddylation protein n=1 Tax=Ostreobium quekettii TaxID=121088 RepID=A0A8S1JI33_9CHLO|nr:unnamed protein product [Ostreobium quekettii]|eukprot:evm.model.scf_89.18 EVM.evm.TU.scf_89.18   scf_89:95984-98982(+)
MTGVHAAPRGPIAANVRANEYGLLRTHPSMGRRAILSGSQCRPRANPTCWAPLRERRSRPASRLPRGPFSPLPTMIRLSRAQKEEVKQFRTITGAVEKVAIEYLKAEGWNLQNAIGYYYTSPPAMPAPKVNRKAIERLWAKYRDPQQDVMQAEGIGNFCEDLQVDPSDAALLVLSWHMKAEVMSEFSKDEFIGGLTQLGCDSIEKLRKRLPDLRAELNDAETFPKIYEYAYMFAREKGQKCVHQPMAIAMWQLLFINSHHWELLGEWINFLENHHNRAISRDTWTQLLDFKKTVFSDFSNFDPSGAWPYLIDEFVEHMMPQQSEQEGLQVH